MHTHPCTHTQIQAHTHKLKHACKPMHTHTHKLHAYFMTTDVRQWNYLWISFMTIEMSQITPTATSPHLSKYTHYFSHSCSHPNAYPTPPLFHNNSMGVPDVNPPPPPKCFGLGCVTIPWRQQEQGYIKMLLLLMVWGLMSLDVRLTY